MSVEPNIDEVTVIASSAGKKTTQGGRTKGAKNYQNSKLMEVVERILPTSSIAWKAVCIDYKIASGETIDRDYVDVKRYWNNKLCDNNRKPTGQSAPNVEVAKAQGK